MVAAVQNQTLTGRLFDTRYRLGTWVALAAIVMLFTALTSAYIVRAGSSNDWQRLPMPRVLLLSTLLILLSSVSLELAKRRLRHGLRTSYVRWLLLTTALGLGFLQTQLLAWRKLVQQGLYVATNPHSSFFYLLTAAHGVHLFAGLMAMIYLVYRSGRREDQLAMARTGATVEATSIYWHFMDGLWIYLFLLLFFWR